jgi:CHASE3 domain sensor protein
MRSSRQTSKEYSKAKPLVQEESSSHAKNKVTPKKAAKVTELNEEAEGNKRDEVEEIISSPVGTPKGSKARKSVPKVTPQKVDTKDSSSSAKSPKNAFGRKTITKYIYINIYMYMYICEII